jgi:hypothetical protein
MKFLYIKCVILVSLVLVANSFAQNYQYFSPYDDDDKAIETKVEELLTKRDVGELADEFLRNKTVFSADDLLIQVSVFARAGYVTQVRETLQIISENQALFLDKSQLYKVVKRAIDRNDLTSLKIYYEKLFVEDTDKIEGFIDLWKQKGNVKEVEAWLKIRSSKDDISWYRWMEFKKSIGELDEIENELTQKIRENAGDITLVEKYLRVVSDQRFSQYGIRSLDYKKDVSWLVDVVEVENAYENYELAIMMTERLPQFAIKLFKKSLSLPFTQKDRKLFGEKAFRGSSINNGVTNSEKQLRYWTKSHLVQLYVSNNQGNLAQPIAEELVAMDKSDIKTGDTYSTAGMAQASSGQRVIESKILQDEATNENSPQYWLNRANYYNGRNEPNLAWDTLILALGRFPYQPNNPKAMFSRLGFVSALSHFGEKYGQSKDVEDSEKGESETSKILRKELIAAKNANDFVYIYQLVNIMHDDYQDLRDDYFTNTNLFLKAISTKQEWNGYDSYKIEIAMESEKWEPEKRKVFFHQLAILARQNIRKRGFGLASTIPKEEHKLAISLLYECLKFAPENDDGDSDYDQYLNFDRRDVLEELISKYCDAGDWKSAEMIYWKDFRYMRQHLYRIAQVAAENGNVVDAVRIWKINVNFDRRNTRQLDVLARTDAKIPLREFYLKLKADTQLREIADEALKILK